MALKKLYHWLMRREPVDNHQRVRNLMEHLNSDAPADRQAADQALREIAFGWDDAYRDYYDADFVVMALDALREAGDERAVPCVRALAERKCETADQERVRDAARACLPRILERVTHRRDHDTLLRAAGPHDEGILLRPAQTMTPPDERLLLRPDAAAEHPPSNKRGRPR